MKQYRLYVVKTALYIFFRCKFIIFICRNPPNLFVITPTEESSKRAVVMTNFNLEQNCTHARYEEQKNNTIFSWVRIEGHNIPAIKYLDQLYVAVKITEKTILSFFPNVFPEEIRHKPPLQTGVLQSHHVLCLNELNKKFNLGYETFETSDTMVLLADFINFYKIIKRHYPNCVKKIQRCAVKKPEKESGWLQINKTLVPFILHGLSEFVPVDVLSNAAKLHTPPNLTTLLPQDKIFMLNNMCSSMQKLVHFTSQSKFVPLHFVEDTHKEKIYSLHYLDKPDIKDPHPTVIEPLNTKTSQNGLNFNTYEQNSTITLECAPDSDINNSNNVRVQSISQDDARKRLAATDQPEERSLKANITSVSCWGKQMLCLNRDSKQFILLEAILRVFFPGLSLFDLEAAIAVVCKLQLVECSDQEKDSFQKMYGIPNLHLSSKKLIEVEIFEKALPELKHMFGMAFSNDKDVICID